VIASTNGRGRQLRGPLVHLPRADLDSVERHPVLIGHLEGTVLTGPKPAVDISEYLATNDGGFMPRGLIFRLPYQFLAAHREC